MQCKCYVCSYQHMANSSFAFWSFLEFFSVYFLSSVGWLWECRAVCHCLDVSPWNFLVTWERITCFVSLLDFGEITSLLATGCLTGCIKHVLNQVWTSLMFYLWTFLIFQRSKFLYCTGFLASRFPSPLLLIALCVWLKNVCVTNKAVCAYSSLKVIMFCSANGAEQDPPFIFLQGRKEI